MIFTAYTIYLVSQIRSNDWRNLRPCLSPHSPRPTSGQASGERSEEEDRFPAPSRRRIGREDRLPERLAPLEVCTEGEAVVAGNLLLTGFTKFLKVCGTLLVLIFTIRLCIAYWGPGERIIEPEVSEEKIQLALKKHNLLRKWKKQDQEIAYPDIFLDQAQSGGYVTKYDGSIVIWKGRLEYIIRDVNGNIKHSGFVLNPSPHDFGKEAFAVTPAAGVEVKAENFQGGDIVFIIARIKTTSRVLGEPGVEFYEILR
jgi:hypothetical protein